MARTTIIECLHEIAENLWWAWQPDMWQIFREIDADVWESTDHNPIAFLNQVDHDTIERRTRESALASRIRSGRRRLAEYVGDQGAKANMLAGPLHAAPVAYFCAEFGIHESLPIYSGGLGVLAGDHMKATSDLGIPVVGVGLLYAMGYFRQTIDENGWQQEQYGRTAIDQLPITKVMGADGKPLEITVEATDAKIKVHVWRAPVGRNELLLLDADVEGNSESDRALTHTLYGGDKQIRIRQELILGVGGVRVLDALDIRPGVLHLNEGHSAFAPLEACRLMMEQEGVTFEEARERVARKTVFTTHTPVPAGHDRFSPELLDQTVGPLRESLGLHHYTFHSFGRINADDPDETFCMTVLAMKFSTHRNGVSHLHGHVSRKMWHALWPHEELTSVPIGHITNGVHTSTFLAPQMKALFDRHLSPDWQSRMDQADAWSGIANAEPAEFWETHQVLKAGLLDFLRTRMQEQHDAIGAPGDVPGSGFDPETLTIGFARRFATYKRATLFMDDLDRILQIVSDSQRPVQFVIAGKAHPKDDGGKSLIQSIWKRTYDPAFKGRIAFVSNYDLNVGRRLVQGVDVWLNNPRRPQEACGTSGQKTVLNGALNCSVLDGWWAEGYDGQNGFAIGRGQEFARVEDQDRFDSAELYRVLEQEVIPLYYDRDENGIPMAWVDRMKWAVTSMGWRFNANRMVLDYLKTAYLPAVGATAT